VVFTGLAVTLGSDVWAWAVSRETASSRPLARKSEAFMGMMTIRGDGQVIRATPKIGLLNYNPQGAPTQEAFSCMLGSRLYFTSLSIWVRKSASLAIKEP
jgi:hypothetical protein